MNITVRNAAYDNLDLLLQRIYENPGLRIQQYYPIIHEEPFYPMLRQLVAKYDLIRFKGESLDRALGPVNLTEEGRKAIKAGGIRQYIIDYDLAESIVDNYPRVVRVETFEGVIIDILFVRDMQEELEANYKYPRDKYKHFTRYSIRPSISSDTSHTAPYAVPPAQGTTNYVFAAPVTNFQNNHSSTGHNQQIIDEEAKEGKWTKAGVILTILGVAATIIATIIAYLEYHPGK